MDSLDKDRLVQLSVDYSHACAIVDTGAAICGGGSALRFSGRKRVMAPPESSAEPLFSLSVGDSDSVDEAHACALTWSAAVCWANKDKWRLAPVLPAGGYVGLADGYGHTCVLEERGRFGCSGRNNYCQANVPPVAHKSLSAGQWSACAIGVWGDLGCWAAIALAKMGCRWDFQKRSIDTSASALDSTAR